MKISGFILAAAVTVSATPAFAATYAVFGSFDAGVANFNATVAGTGATPTAFSLPTGSNGVYTNFAITRASGTAVTIGAPYTLFGSSPSRATTGGIVDISPAGPNTTPRGNPLLYKPSGITFTFLAPVNALGFEVGDWATCCQPSNLWIQFGAGTPIQVGASTTPGDQFLTNGGAGVFVGAFDNSNTFTTVSFWGDGVGEYLVAGGTIRYANVGVGTPLPGVPEPASWAMMILGVGAVGAAARRRRYVVTASIA